ncbi:FYVE, RhoGEF and PH domain-containing protein 6 isoform X2 [Hypanus sabinus]|uniref:FYVE, RhoGEF and PH domain-containing protein 6 isoform X2 n=1 Tax=Hypanus sabinus TaxID=79690 RepID=UPI0028C49DBB|nr:FYVE, RhoGEF and PH domain-containing protein 6 isoform X2 [Hypanus sabinus]
MSAEIKKPPVAPKPRFVLVKKPPPPPVAPKPDVIILDSLSAQKGSKPALAPKPVLPKITPVAEVKPTPLQNYKWSEEIKSELCEKAKYPVSEDSDGMQRGDCELTGQYIISNCLCKSECEHKYINGENTCKTKTVSEHLGKLKTFEANKKYDQTKYSPQAKHRSETQHSDIVNKHQAISKTCFLEQKFKDVLTQVVTPNNYLPRQKDTHGDGDVKLLSSNSGQSELFSTDQNIRSSKSTEKGNEIKIASYRAVMKNEKSCQSMGTDPIERVHESQAKVAFAVDEKDKLIFQDSNLITASTSNAAPCSKPVPMPKPKAARLVGLVRQRCIDDCAEGPKVTCIDSFSRTSDEHTFDTRKSFVPTDGCIVSKYNNSNKTFSTPFHGNNAESSQAKESCVQRGVSSIDPCLGSPSEFRISSDLQNRSKIEQIKRDLENGNRTLPSDAKSSFIRNTSVSMSLPKYLGLSFAQTQPESNNETGSDFKKETTKMSISPKPIPKKPQRHSMPIAVAARRDVPTSSPNDASRALENNSKKGHNRLLSRDTDLYTNEHEAICPNEKPIWKLAHPILPLPQSPTTAAVSSNSQDDEELTAKPRAKSLSSADTEKPEKSTKLASKKNSFKRILAIKLSAKVKNDFQRFLSKGSCSLDSMSSVHDSEKNYQDDHQCISGLQIGDQKKRPTKAHSTDSCLPIAKDQKPKNLSKLANNFTIQQESCIDLKKDCPGNAKAKFHSKYENISPNFDWKNSSSVEDSDTLIYEIEPYAVSNCYQKYGASLENRCISPVQDQDNLSSEMDINSEEEEIIFSSDEEDDSSDASKGELDQHDEKQNDKGKKTKVYHIAREIMSSEKVFVDVLKLLHIDFRDSVIQASRQYGKQVIDDKTLNQVLYYLPQLYELNRGLLRELEERMAHWDKYQRIADIFMEKGPYLKMYSTYIKEFDKNICLLDEQCKKNPTFAAVVREFEMSSRCANLALKHYLLKPVQRIPQYKLLLTDYVKNLSKDCADYKDTQAALAIVVEVANHANDIMKQGDNFQKLMQIQYSLNGQQEIVQPGRVFLKEGTLMKLSRKVMQPRMFFLLNDVLLYTTPVQSGTYKLNNMLSLAGMKVSKPSQEAYQNELNIESVERSFILSASSAAERDEWLKAISKAIEEYTKKRITFTASKSLEFEIWTVNGGGGVCGGLGCVHRSNFFGLRAVAMPYCNFKQEEPDKPEVNTPLGTKAPIWIPDPRATMCMVCTCDFTLTWRRHHCRACGKIVCQACSSNKFNLDYLKNRPARVCDYCFSELQKREMQSPVTRMASPTHKPSSSLTSVFHSIQHSSGRKHKKIPAALKEVSANTGASSMSGYLYRSKGTKKPWKRLWFVIQDKVLYTYAASEDVAALESQPLLGFTVSEVEDDLSDLKVIFQLFHKRTLFYVFKADDPHTARRWVEVFQEATVL